MKRFYYWVLIPLVAGIAGCSPYGYIYHHTTRPLDKNMMKSPSVASKASQNDIKHFSYNIIDIRRGSNGIGDSARTHGLTEIDFVDIETLRILGIWEQKYVHLYGQ